MHKDKDSSPTTESISVTEEKILKVLKENRLIILDIDKVRDAFGWSDPADDLLEAVSKFMFKHLRDD